MAGGAGGNRGIFTIKKDPTSWKRGPGHLLTETDTCIWTIPCLWWDGAGGPKACVRRVSSIYAGRPGFLRQYIYCAGSVFLPSRHTHNLLAATTSMPPVSVSSGSVHKHSTSSKPKPRPVSTVATRAVSGKNTRSPI